MDLKRLIEIIDKPLSEIEIDINLAGALVRYYRYIFPNENSCSGCISKMYSKLKTVNLEAMANCDFKLKDGVCVEIVFGSGRHISNMNLTNELAIEFLTINPKRASLFVKLPDDWQSSTPKPTKAEAKKQAPKKPRIYKKKI